MGFFTLRAKSSPFGTVLLLSCYGGKLPQSQRSLSGELPYAARERSDPPLLQEHQLSPVLAFTLTFSGLFVPFPDEAFFTKTRLGEQPRPWSCFYHH